MTTCAGVFAAHTGEDVRSYRLMGRREAIDLCSGCAAEAMKHTALDRRADPERADRGSRWNVGPIGRRRVA